MCEPYNGWINRETWAFWLWVTNEPDLYSAACAYAAGMAPGIDDRDAAVFIEDIEERLWDTHTDAGGPDYVLDRRSWQRNRHTARSMLSDVGSFYRIDRFAIAEHLQELRP